MTERTFGPAGGSGGEAFEANCAPAGARIAAVHVWSGFFVDSVQLVYQDAAGQESKTDRVGGFSGLHHVFTLDADETLIGISGRCANYIDSLRLHTNKRTSETYGGWGGTTEYTISAPAGSEIVGFFGRAGWYIDALGIVTRALAAVPAAAEPAPTETPAPAAPKPRGRKPKAAATAEAAPDPAPAVESEPAPKKAKGAPRKAKSVPAEAPVVEARVAAVEIAAIAAKTPNPAELEKIEGVGPKLAQTLVENGINDLADLAATPVERLKEILAGAGGRYKLADPTTWPAQAALGAAGDWDGFAKLQAELKGGRKR